MYYFYTWGGAARNTTLTLNGYRVKFLSWGGISGSTWLYHDGAWYYVQKYSCVTNGWYQIDGAWYFMNADGSLKQNESFLYDNNLYFVNKSGKMYQNQWLKWDGNYYYLRSWGGAAHEGWLLLQNKYYYINEDCTRKPMTAQNLPKITKGVNQSGMQGKELSFTADFEAKDLKKVLIDQKEIDAKNYVTAGKENTQVTLKAEYTKSLAEGKHTLHST